MKKKMFTVIIGVFFMFGTLCFSEERTLFGSAETKSGGYGAVEVKSGKFDNEDAMFIGGKGGWIINSLFTIGGGGYSSVGSLESSDGVDMKVSYGGVIIGMTLISDSIIHLEINSLFGSGSVESDGENSGQIERDNFDIIEPGLNIEFNITEFFRIAGGVSYRMVSGLDYKEYESKDLEGASVNLAFKFGSF